MDIGEFALEDEQPGQHGSKAGPKEIWSNGIKMPYLSPSTINSFIERRPSWYDSKVLGAPFNTNPAMARGTAVEHAINEWLRLGEEAVPKMCEIAEAKFDQELVSYMKNCSTKARDDAHALRASLPGLVEVAYKHFKSEFTFNKPIGQGKINTKLKGVQRDVLGYMDYFIPGKKVIDCKVSAKKPSGLSQGYKIQGAIYNQATGVPVEFHFIIGTKEPKVETILMTDDDCVFGISYATQAAKVLEELEECKDPKRVMELMAFPNLDSLWNYEEKLDAAKRFGIALA